MVVINFKCKKCGEIFDFELKVKKHENGLIEFEEEPYCENCARDGDIGELELSSKGQKQISILFSKLNNGGK
jgi:uncharacterized OB-fold protein